MSEATIEWTQPHVGFQAPEFYTYGPVAIVSANGRSITVRRDGLALLYRDPTEEFSAVEVIRLPSQFRRAFPTGVVPEDDTVEWRLNAWFDLYEGDEHLDAVSHTLADAFEEALSIVARESLSVS